MDLTDSSAAYASWQALRLGPAHVRRLPWRRSYVPDRASSQEELNVDCMREAITSLFCELLIIAEEYNPLLMNGFTESGDRREKIEPPFGAILDELRVGKAIPFLGAGASRVGFREGGP